MGLNVFLTVWFIHLLYHNITILLVVGFKLRVFCLRREVTEQERRRAEADMMKGFHSMRDRYDEQRKQLKDREPWIVNDKKTGKAPSVMTVTHVNQTKDLYVSY